MSSDRLNVIALISGGKDSFFSLLHCIENGHRVVALANLYPARDGETTSVVQVIQPSQDVKPTTDTQDGDDASKRDLNSFMYQTVGHEVIPLYAQATGLPLYRQAIHGGAVRHERDYDHGATGSAAESVGDETESMVPLLQAVMARHPEANALSSGAILSAYQRTRVESIALRLGLVPLAYLWKYTILPSPSTPADPAQLLIDMAAAGLEARIIKVASAGLDESHLWEKVSSEIGALRVKSALRKFGPADGAVLGEGGEFETLVVDGPSRLFKRSVGVADGGRTVIDEGGGSSWLMLRGARLLEKVISNEEDLAVREPHLLDVKFKSILDELVGSQHTKDAFCKKLESSSVPSRLGKSASPLENDVDLLHWSVLAPDSDGRSIREETVQVIAEIRRLLASANVDPADITSVIVILRDMANFPQVNEEYGKLFTKPNPPSRITISSGDLLPAGSNILIHIKAPPPRAIAAVIKRDGLHVQSRSYWAPANIGPYSQAINIPVPGLGDLKSVYIAGQIPLLPAAMILPAQSDTSLLLEVALSLQHLWRIGLEMKVQYWTSAVAYFARVSSSDEMKQKAKIAGQAWGLAHGPQEEGDEADNGPDLWDLKYNPHHMSLAGDGQTKTAQTLPDWSTLTMRQQNEPETCIPPMFAIEVEELPRKSQVEWHAHVGLSNIAESSAELLHLSDVGEGWEASHTIVHEPNTSFVHTALSCRLPQGDQQLGLEDLVRDLGAASGESIKRLAVDEQAQIPGTPYLVYLDATKINLSSLGAGSEAGMGLPFAHVPCRSLWSPQGKQLACVALYKKAWQR